MLSFRFNIKYKVSVKFGFRLFKYLFYYRIPVLLILLYSKLKLLFSFRWYSIQNPFLGFSGYFRLLVGVCEYLILIEFGGFLGYRADINKNLGGFPRF